MISNQLQLSLYGAIKDKECLQPLDLNSLKFHWSHHGNFNQDLYEKILKEKEKRNENTSRI